MPAPDTTIMVVSEWVAKAENDLTNAVHSLTLGERCPTDTVCFHAQQCVEKYLKALLVLRSIPFSKTHNIRVLMVLVPEDLRPAIPEDLQNTLTQ